MKKGTVHTGIVDRVDFPNKGIVLVDSVQEDGSVDFFHLNKFL